MRKAAVKPARRALPPGLVLGEIDPEKTQPLALPPPQLTCARGGASLKIQAAAPKDAAEDDLNDEGKTYGCDDGSTVVGSTSTSM